MIRRVRSVSSASLLLLIACLSASPLPPSLPRIIDLSAQDTFAQAGISPAERLLIASVVEQNSADWQRSRIAKMRARRVVLSPRGMQGLVLRATAPEDCGGTGNCMLTVLRRRGSEWQVVTSDVFADGFGFSRTTHHGVYDLAFSANDSAESSMLTLLAFDGSRYRNSKCFRAVTNGTKRVVTPTACPSEGQ